MLVRIANRKDPDQTASSFVNSENLKCTGYWDMKHNILVLYVVSNSLL